MCLGHNHKKINHSGVGEKNCNENDLFCVKVVTFTLRVHVNNYKAFFPACDAYLLLFVNHCRLMCRQ